MEDHDAVANNDERWVLSHPPLAEVLVGVGVVVITGLDAPVAVAETVTEAASRESLEACDCNADICVEMVVFSHLLRNSCKSDSRRFKLGTW